MSRRGVDRRALVTTLALVALLGVACGKGGGGDAPKAKRDISFPVETRAVESRRVEYSISAVGSVAAFEETQITARVAGVVEKVRFREGSSVKQGDVLVEVEPARYDIAVRSARAVFERARAARNEAARLLALRERLQHDGLSSPEEVEQARARVATGDAELAQAQSALDLAQLNLRDAYVRTPADGTVQTRQVATGQYVQAGTVLATLVQREPLLLRFEVPEFEAAKLRRAMPVRFSVRGIDGEGRARLLNVAAKADERTRMVAVVGEIEAPGAELRPGAFAEITVPVGSTRDAPVVPETAIRPSERGFLCYVVEDGVAKERVLTLGLRTTDGLIEVRSGLSPGEELVVHGSEALRDGASVRMAAAPSETAAAELPPPPSSRGVATPPARVAASPTNAPAPTSSGGTSAEAH